MNTGNVKRSIQIEEVKDDIFSDDIKTTALIEEIEAAEAAAKRAKIEKQIENSQPTKTQRIGKSIAEKSNILKDLFKNKLADLKTKQPKDPRVKKTSLKSKIGGFAGKINKLAPEGVSQKTIVEACIAAALIVAGVEIWAWNFSHPLFQSSNDKIEVPITGDTEPVNEPDDDSPFATQEEKKEEKTEEDKAEGGESQTSGNTVNYTRPANRVLSNNTSQPKNTSKKSSSSTNSAKQYTGTTVDNDWNDSYGENWPTYEEPQQEPEEPSESEGAGQEADSTEQDNGSEQE